MTTAFRLRQTLLIARLELGRAFFSKRAFWVYLLALFPAVLFFGHGLAAKLRTQEWSKQAITPALYDSLNEGDTLDSVVTRLGPPFREHHWQNREQKREHRWIAYSDGKRRLELSFENGILVSRDAEPLVDFERDRTVYATIFQFFYLRLAIFFGCLGIFMNLFRGEMLDKTLHYWFLGPARREVLLAGKYLAGLAAAALIFGLGTILSFWAMSWYQEPAAWRLYWTEQGASHLAWYTAAAVLGSLGYGSVFLAAGLLVRNPIIPAVILLVWEAANGFLPAALQKLSVLFYLQSMCPVPPVPPDDDVPALIKLLLSPAEPATGATAVFGLFAVTALVLWAAARAVRRLEINYSTD